jgi:hypothetical protein
MDASSVAGVVARYGSGNLAITELESLPNRM